MHSFNDKQIDADHDLIIMKFDEICSLVCYANYSNTNRLELMDQLQGYLTNHFEREEQLMSVSAYDHLAQHRMAHRNMQTKFNRLREQTPEGEHNLESDLRHMRKMFLSHIVTFDEAFGEWLSRHRDEGKDLTVPKPKPFRGHHCPNPTCGRSKHRARLIHALRLSRIRL
jgi:hemerythrin-like metal-binding protein